jgi:hypothetical protein
VAQDKVWFRVPDKSELPLGASSYWGFECHVCKTRMAIGDAGTTKAEQIQAIAAQKTGGKQIWVICPSCGDENQLYRSDEIVVFSAK